MKSGLLWYGAQKPLADAIADAATRYREKYGRPADTVFVNPSDADGNLHSLNAQFTPHGMAIYSKATILPHYVWLGVSNQPPKHKDKQI